MLVTGLAACIKELALSAFSVVGPDTYDGGEPMARPPAHSCTAALTQLRALGLAFPEAMHLARAAVQAALLKPSAGQLRKLSLFAGCDIGIPVYLDSQFAALLARQPHLTSLTFTIGCAITPKCFRVAGESCR
jgi:hypothetical protein